MYIFVLLGIMYIADLTAKISAYHKCQLKYNRMPRKGKDIFFHLKYVLSSL